MAARDTRHVGVTDRLADLDAHAVRRWPWLEAKRQHVSLRLIVFYQAFALVEILVGVGIGNDMVTGMAAAAPLVLGIGAAWRLLYSAGERAE